MEMTRAEFLKLALGMGAGAAIGAPLKAFAAGLTGTISYLTYESLPTTKKVTGDLIAALEAANPGLKINPLFTSPEAVRKQVASMLQSGTAPDIVNLDIEDATLYAHSKLLEPVSDIVGTIKNLPDRWRARIDGQDFFVPMGVKFTYSWYRSDLFEKAGLQPPKTWAEFEAAAKKLTGDGQYGYVVSSNETGDNPVSSLFSYAFSNGVNFVDDDGNVVFDQGENKAALAETLAFITRMSKFSPSGTNFGWGEIINSFASGKVAMADYIGSRLFAVTSQNNPQLAEVTKPMLQPYGKATANRLSAEGFMVFKGSKNKEVAKSIITYLREGQRYFDYLWSIPLHVLPATKEDFLGGYQQDDFVKKHQDIVKVIDSAWDHARNPVYDLKGTKPSWQRARIYTSTVYNKMLANVVQGGADPAAAIDQAAKAARALVKNA
ncbi:ABC transporter substrate-binding protein [Bradyrhizobium sp. SYSU BS000235]|uniref:ABC transporter substrate-binding protein n=1 Tax=Bradyrhizobium sp. SYSU BS000235 TaxID=3411332 RepID=UPI003C77333F